MESKTDILSSLLRTDLKSFCIKVFNTVSSADTYMDNWHIDVICNELEQMIDGNNNRLIINIPPPEHEVDYLFSGTTRIFTGA